ncbi:selenium binding protein [Lactococcus lactis]|uniref:selenium binding protein n=1 Tax=Lactococcus lactis TaxID=1358 RepID=UPI001C0F808D|nr:selenium binding protein [Lactococcus lactis]MBU5243729.1 selenium binding protein [Lactococcus lactis]
MYEDYTRQALPSKEYRELLGTCLCVFNSNNSFVIENMLSNSSELNWYNLVDLESGRLRAEFNKMSSPFPEAIVNLFLELVVRRNRIIHSFQITMDNVQILATKTRVRDGNEQFIISKEYLIEFISMNEKLSTLLHEFRGY